MKRLIIGDEFDTQLRDNLIQTLKAMGATPVSTSWGVAGTQELSIFSVQIREHIIEIEAETFMGLSISGCDLVVEEIISVLSEVR
jgi:hypothetical protein